MKKVCLNIMTQEDVLVKYIFGVFPLEFLRMRQGLDILVMSRSFSLRELE